MKMVKTFISKNGIQHPVIIAVSPKASGHQITELLSLGWRLAVQAG